MEEKGLGVEELSAHLGRGRSRKGMFEGDMEDGELEIGQISGLISEVLPAKEIVEEILEEYQQIKGGFSATKSRF